MFMADVFFRGKKIEELASIDERDFMKLITSRARRTLNRSKNLQMKKKIKKASEAKKAGKYPKPIKTHRRDTIVTPDMLGLNFAVHRGNTFESIEVKPEMLGHYFGEFVFTRKRIVHGKAGIGATKSSTAIATKK